MLFYERHTKLGFHLQVYHIKSLHTSALAMLLVVHCDIDLLAKHYSKHVVRSIKIDDFLQATYNVKHFSKTSSIFRAAVYNLAVRGAGHRHHVRWPGIVL